MINLIINRVTTTFFVSSYLSRILFWIVPNYLSHFSFRLKTKHHNHTLLYSFFYFTISPLYYFIQFSTLFNSLNKTFLNSVSKKMFQVTWDGGSIIYTLSYVIFLHSNYFLLFSQKKCEKINVSLRLERGKYFLSSIDG